MGKTSDLFSSKTLSDLSTVGWLASSLQIAPPVIHSRDAWSILKVPHVSLVWFPVALQ